jgi:hypothetical protein
LQVPVDLRLKMSKALVAQVRRTQLRLYVILLRLYLLKFSLEAMCILKRLTGTHDRKLLQVCCCSG